MSEEAFEVPERNEYRYLVQDETEEEVQYARRFYASPFLVVSRRCMFLIGCGVLVLLTLAGYLAYVAQTPRRGYVEVLTDCGSLRGRHKSDSYSFKGIPYAEPPVGERRWRPPADLKEVGQCWQGVYDATRFRNVCTQMRPLRRDGQVMGQEDCLYLSVWTPSLAPGVALPVMVWLHGGNLQMLSGQEEGYSPTEELASRTQTVYVSVNYRLGVFGFMALEVLREGSKGTSGNYGIRDQIQALHWVQRNIHAFGGDPAKVTIFGGTSVWALMISPPAKGLFHRAISMSGSLAVSASLEPTEKQNMVFLKRSGCQDALCLRKLNTTQILQAVPWQEFPSWGKQELKDIPVKGSSSGAVLVLDDRVLSARPFEDIYNDVPLVVGTTEQELDYSPPSENISTWTWGDYEWFLTEKLRPFGESVVNKALKLYNSSAPCPTSDRCPERQYTTLVSDVRVTCPNNQLSKRAAEVLKSPVYRYLVTFTPSKAATSSSLLPYPSRFSFHMLDSLAFLGGLDTALGTLTPSDRQFQQTLTKHFIHFATEGKMQKEWPEFPSYTALVDRTLTAVQNPVSERCALWEEAGINSSIN